MSAQQLSALTHPEDRAISTERARKRMEGQDLLPSVTVRILRKDGSTGWTQAFNVPIEYDGKPAILSNNIDITEQKRAEAENNRRVSELEALYENGLLISELFEPKKIAQKMVDILSNKLNWHHAAIRLYRPEDDRMELLALSQPGLSEEEIEENIRRLNQMLGNVDRGLSGWVIRNKQAVRSGDLPDDSRYIESYSDMHSGLYVPIQMGDEVLGSIAVEVEDENAFNERDERLLVTLANQAAIAIRNAQLYLQTKKEVEERKCAEEERNLVEEEIRRLNIELEKRVEDRTAEIESTRQRLELATKAAGLGIWEWNLSTDKLLWDSQMYKVYGTPRDKFDEKIQTFMNFVHHDDPQDLLKIAQAILRKEEHYQTEYRIIRPDYSVRNIAAQGVILYDSNNEPEKIIGIADDITPRKQAEQALQESETYARLLFDAAPDPVSVSDVDGTVIDVNNLFEQQHQVKREEIRGRNIYELGFYPSKDLDKRREYVAAMMEGGDSDLPPVELDFYTPTGEMHTLEMRAYPIEVGGKSLVLGTSRDVTVHTKAEETLRFANVEMEHALRIKDEFLASMSHELRTPLNAILGISESLEEQIIGALNEKQLKYLRTINESGHHLHELINDILDLSKVEAGRMELSIVDVQMEHLCQASIRMVKELAQKKGLNLSVSLDPTVKTIKGDERRLKQILVNLLSNAVKFTSSGQEIGLELQGYPEISEVTLTVWDHGIGISPQDINRLFKPFVQLDSGLSREYAGTGLGLALVAQMVRLHGGNVAVESKIDKGSRFIVTLPWTQEGQGSEAKFMPLDAEPISLSEGKRSGRILIVEDTETVISLMKDYLDNKAYEVFIARIGIEGVSLAKTKHPELILMDVMMPIMDGLEATREIRADESLKNIPIIALTALAMPGDRERCFAAGMNDYLSKPSQFKELLGVMDRHMASAKSEEA